MDMQELDPKKLRPLRPHLDEWEREGLLSLIRENGEPVGVFDLDVEGVREKIVQLREGNRDADK